MATLTLKSILKNQLTESLLLIFVPLILLLLMLIEPIRATISPLILGFVAAYILMPFVRFVIAKTHIPRSIVILFIFVIFACITGYTTNRAVRLYHQESRQVFEDIQEMSSNVKNSKEYPQIVQDSAKDLFDAAQEYVKVKQKEPFPLVKNALGRILTFILFLLSFFYFLRDEEVFMKLFKKNELSKRLHSTMGSYVRGQLFLIFLMSALTWIFLGILHIKLSFLLALFTGFAEVVPIVGPILATILTISVVFLTNTSAFGQPPYIIALIALVGYVVLRQIEDLLIIPYVMSKSVHLHPLVIVFSTLLAERLYGFIGLLLAVPFVAIYKVILEYVREKYIDR